VEAEMSFEGWQEFLAACAPDWVVLHGGAVDVYRLRTGRQVRNCRGRAAVAGP